MNRFVYYSWFWLGALACAGFVGAGSYETLPNPRWLILAAISVPAGVVCQLLFIGTQGTFAQVLPVPIGRSIRGRGAVVTGALIILTIVAAAIAWLSAVDEITGVTIAAIIISAACGLCAAGGYIWCLPTSVRDFAGESRPSVE